MSLFTRFSSTNFNHNATVSMIELTGLCAFMGCVGFAKPGTCIATNSPLVCLIVLMLACVVVNMAIAIYAVSARKILKRMASRTDEFISWTTIITLILSVGSSLLGLHYQWFAYVGVGILTVSAYVVYFSKPSTDSTAK